MSPICHSAALDCSGRTSVAAVVDLERARVECEIADQLVAGHVGVTRLASAVGDVDLWHRAARRAGRLRGVPVRIGVAHDGSKVWVVDES